MYIYIYIYVYIYIYIYIYIVFLFVSKFCRGIYCFKLKRKLCHYIIVIVNPYVKHKVTLQVKFS